MPDITKIQIGDEPERSYKNFPANREFKKRAEDENPSGGWPANLPVPASEGYGHFVYITQSFNFASGPLPWDGLYWGNPVARGKLTIGDTYLVGTAQGNVECVCFDNDGFPTIGKSDDDMQETGDWQICEDSGEIYCGVVGLENDVFDFTIYNLPLAVPVKIDEKFLPDPDVMIVKLTYDEDTQTLTADKTFNEMYEQLSNDKPLVVFESGVYVPINNISEEQIVLSSLQYTNDIDDRLCLTNHMILINDDETIEVSNIDYYLSLLMQD